MSAKAIRRVGVVGGGQMGAGIAEVCARTGLDTVVCEAEAFVARTAGDISTSPPPWQRSVPPSATWRN